MASPIPRCNVSAILGSTESRQLPYRPHTALSLSAAAANISDSRSGPRPRRRRSETPRASCRRRGRPTGPRRRPSGDVAESRARRPCRDALPLTAETRRAGAVAPRRQATARHRPARRVEHRARRAVVTAERFAER